MKLEKTGELDDSSDRSKLLEDLRREIKSGLDYRERLFERLKRLEESESIFATEDIKEIRGILRQLQDLLLSLSKKLTELEEGDNREHRS